MFNVHVQQKVVYAVQIEWPNIIHGFCASQRVDPATLLRGLTPEALKEWVSALQKACYC